MDRGVEELRDEEVKAQLRRLARKVYLESILAAMVLTLVFLAFPT